MASGRVNITENWFLNSAITLDLDEYRRKTSNALNSDAITSLSVGAGYVDECTTFTVTLTSTPVSGATNGARYNRTILARLELLTLGEVGVSQDLSQDSSNR